MMEDRQLPISPCNREQLDPQDEGSIATSLAAPMPEPAILTVKQAAAFLQVSVNHLYSLIAQDSVPYVRLGKLIRIPRWSLLQYIASASGAPLADVGGVALPAPESVHVHQPMKEGD